MDDKLARSVPSFNLPGEVAEAFHAARWAAMWTVIPEGFVNTKGFQDQWNDQVGHLQSQAFEAGFLRGLLLRAPSPVPPTPGPDGLDRTEDGRTDCTGTSTVRTSQGSSTSSGPSILRSSESSPVQGGTGGDTSAIEDHLRSLGLTSPRHIQDGAANLAKFRDPIGVVEVLQRHCQRFRAGTSWLPLLAHILQKSDQIKAVVREMADKEHKQDLLDLLRNMRLQA